MTRRVAWRVARTQTRDVARGRWFQAYALFFLLATEALCRFGDGGPRALLTVTDLVLFVVPLVSIVFGTMYGYHTRDFVELLLAQPVRRRSVFAGLFAGLAVPLSAGFALGVGLPFLFRGLVGGQDGATLAIVILIGIALTFAFSALGLLVAVRSDDRLRGLGLALGAWLVLAVAYDGLVLFAASALADYPLERPLLGAVLANPIDLARILMLLRFDAAALLGYTGAVFQGFFHGPAGAVAALAGLMVWIGAPLGWAARTFVRKDF